MRFALLLLLTACVNPHLARPQFHPTNDTVCKVGLGFVFDDARTANPDGAIVKLTCSESENLPC